MKNWYSIKNRATGVVDISIHDEIGMWGVSAADFMAELRSHNDVAVINLSIHSPGGSVLDGLAIYNSLRMHSAKIYGHVEGIAASAASFILMASDTISMPEDAFIMIHNAHGGVMGDAEEMREMADVVEKLQNSIVNIYHRRTGMEPEDILAMMKVETWMNAEEALVSGFIDNIVEPAKIAAKMGLFNKHFRSPPVKADEITNAEKVDDIKTVSDFEKFLRDAGGFSKGLAQELTSRGKSVLRVDPDSSDDDALQDVVNALDKVVRRVAPQL